MPDLKIIFLDSILAENQKPEQSENQKPELENENQKPELENENQKPRQEYYESQKPATEYDCYVSLIVNNDFVNIIPDDDDDAALIAGIEASLQEKANCFQENASDVLLLYVSENLNVIRSGEGDLCYPPDNTINIVINRSTVYTSTLKAIQRSSFSFHKPVSITFAGEEAVDIGGPKREYFRLLMLEIRNSELFCYGWFSHDLSSLNVRKYETAGKLVAWSILQGGGGPKCLAENVFLLVNGLPVDSYELIANISDKHLKNVLLEFYVIADQKTFDAAVNKYGEFIATCGYARIYMAKLCNKEELINCLIKQHYMFNVHAEIQQFTDGLNCIGNFGNIVMKNKSVFQAVLGDTIEHLTVAKFKRLYKINYSEQGSNYRIKETETMYSFEVYLQDLDEGCVDELGLEDLLIFITGAAAVPPLGFDRFLAIDFYNQEPGEKRLPWSSTCSMSLKLPRGVGDPDVFADLLKLSLSEGHGFW